MGFGFRMCVSAALLLGACGAPSGFLGARWGDDASATARRLGLSCAWTSWEGGRGFEGCFDTEHAQGVFGERTFVRLLRHGPRIEAISIRFPHCAGVCVARVRAEVRRTFEAPGPPADNPYQVWSDGSLVHLETAHGDAQLTVAGPRFGPMFQSWLLAQGLGALRRGLAPR